MSESDPWEVLVQLDKTECPECGAENEKSSQFCCECQAVLPEEEEGGFSLMSGGGDLQASPYQERKQAAAGFHERENVAKLMRAVAGARDTSLSVEEYSRLVSEVQKVAATSLALFRGPIRAVPDDPRAEAKKAMTAAMEQQLAALHGGTTRMLAYLKTGDIEDVDQGWFAAEQSMIEIDRLQEAARNGGP